jgi:photosystem II stability/assembly factor-like uncharacterized protein
MDRNKRFIVFPILIAAAVMTCAPLVARSQVPFSQLVSKLRWRNIGPSVGGRVVAVSGVAQQPNVFYMGAVDGGIWKSDDYGTSWKNISDKTLHSSNIGIGSMEVAPSDPSVIYAGTGEADIRNDLITGNGIYKSSDAGKTWQYIGLGDTNTTSDIVVDPRNPAVVYVASLGHVFVPNSEGGVYKTSDGGQTWKKVLFVNDGTGAIDLAMDAQNRQILYAATWQVQRTPWQLTSGGPGSGLYKTTDGGAHWVNITHRPGLPQGIAGRIGVAVAPSQPNTVYAIVQARHGGLFRSDDAGQTWKRVNNNWELRQRGFYYSTVYVSPKDPNTIYMPEVRALWVSYDGGRKIGMLHTPHGDNHIAWINPNNPNIILEGNDGGATVSVNGGKTWTGEHEQPTGEFYHVTLDDQFPFHIYTQQQDEGASEGPSSEAGSIPLADWHRVAGSEASWIAPQPGKPWITYGSGYFTIMQRENRQLEASEDVSPWPDYQSGAASDELKYRFAWTHPILFSPSNPQELLVGAQCVLKSMDYGDSWSCISPDLTRNDKSTQGQTGGPIMLDESAAEIYPYISALAVSRLDNNEIWAGSSDGLVHVTSDDGRHWTDVTPPQMKARWGWISSVAASDTSKGMAYLSVSRYMWDDSRPYVYETADYGEHWTEIIHGLPDDEYATSVTVDPRNKSIIFLGARNAVYVSVNGGASWEPLSLNLPRALVMDVAIQPQQNGVVIATHGRAIWVLDDLALLEQLADGAKAAQGSAQLFNPQLTWLTKSYGGRSLGGRPPSAGESHPFGTSVFFYLPASYNGETPVTLKFTTASGEVVNTFKLHLRKKPGKHSLAVAATATTADSTAVTTAKRAAAAQANITAVAPGMNLFQWDLRYPGSSAIDGYYSPGEATNDYDPARPGPEVVPGTYYAVLQYGDHLERASFAVKLDPRLSTTQSELQARQQLLFNITGELKELAAEVNVALAMQRKLQDGPKTVSPGRDKDQVALSKLEKAIGVLVQMNMYSSEGDLTVEPALRERMAALFSIVSGAYVQPRKAEYAVYDSLKAQIQAGLAQLRRVEDETRGLVAQWPRSRVSAPPSDLQAGGSG